MEQHDIELLSGCPICGSGSAVSALQVVDHSVTAEIFQLQDCPTCGFRFTNPRPTQRSIGRYYQSENYISHTNSERGVLSKVYQAVRKHSLANKYSILRRFHPYGKVLDIGCGTGEFLAYLMGRGYVVQGVEPSPKAREQAIANHAIEVLPTVEQVPTLEQFQVVTLWHVLEHLPDLHTIFKRLFAMMSNDGVLLIAVPDRESWDAGYYGSSWAAWDAPRHLSHFRRKDIERLLHDHGFELVGTRPMWFDAPYVSLLSEQYLGKGKFISWCLGIIIGGLSNLNSLLTGRPTSSTLFIAKKSDL